MHPLLVLALLTAASSGANYMGQKKVDKGRAVAMRESERRRKEAEARSRESAQSTTELLTNAGRNQDAKAAELEAQYGAAPLPPTTASPQFGGFTAPAGSSFTVADDQRAMDRVRADTGSLAKAKAGLNAYGDAMVGAQIGANANLGDIEQENTGVRNWNQYVLPQQLDRANASGKDWGMLADAIQIAASIYGPIGLSKAAGAAANVGAGSASTIGGGVGIPGQGVGGGVFKGGLTIR